MACVHVNLLVMYIVMNVYRFKYKQVAMTGYKDCLSTVVTPRPNPITPPIIGDTTSLSSTLGTSITDSVTIC